MGDGTDSTDDSKDDSTDDGAPIERTARSIWDVVGGIADVLDARWDAGRRRLARPGVRHVALSAVVVAALALRSIRDALDQALHRINEAGRPAVGLEALHSGTEATDAAFTTWEAGAMRLEQFIRHDPPQLAIAQSVVSLILVPLIAIVLFGVARHLRADVATQDGERRLLCVSMAGAAAYLALGIADHVFEIVVLTNGGAVSVVTWVLEVTPWVRRSLVALILVPVVVVVIRRAGSKHTDATAPWWRGAPTAYRTVLIIAVLHIVLFGFSVPGRQTEDALRLWASRPLLGVVGVVATALLSVTLALYATRIGSAVVQYRDVMGRTATITLIGVAIGLAIMGIAAGAVGFPLMPLLVSLAIVTGVTGLLSIPLITSSPLHGRAPTGPSPLAREIVPGLVAAAPFVALTLALVRAAVPSLLDSSAIDRQTHLHLVTWSIVAGAAAVAAYPLARAVAKRDVEARAAARRARAAEKRQGSGDAGMVEQSYTHTPRQPEFDTAGPKPQRDWFLRYALVLGGISGVAAIVIVAAPVRTAPQFGVVAIIGLFLTLVVTALGALAVQFDGKALPASLDFVRFQKVPVFTGLVVVGFISQAIAGSGYHDVDTRDVEPAETTQLTIDAAFERWAETHADTAASGEAVPLVFVTAAGGGLKAAAFTSTVLDCIFAPTGETTVVPDDDDDVDGPVADVSEGTPAPAEAARKTVDETLCARTPAWDGVFALSGASGGSVGIASVIAAAEDDGDTEQWVSERLGKDLLSPSIAWQLFVEVPNAIAAFHPDDDRASILDATWRDQFDVERGELPFYRPVGDGWPGPIPFFSGTNLEDGCRVNVSPIRAGAPSPELGVTEAFARSDVGLCSARRVRANGVIDISDQGDTYDLADFLCDENVDLATASFLSARFPYVSPVATASSCDGAVLSIGDGGYRDNSGASTVADLWGVLEPLVDRYNRDHAVCVVPIWLEIGTGYAGLDGGGTSSNIAQTVAPAIGAAAVFGDLSYGAVEQLAAEFTRPLSSDRIAVLGDTGFSRHLRISLVDHPGVTAPLGWSLSPAAVEDFEQQLQVNENQEAVNRMSHILGDDSTLGCRSE